jgi:hypothetical protein
MSFDTVEGLFYGMFWMLLLVLVIILILSINGLVTFGVCK